MATRSSQKLSGSHGAPGGMVGAMKRPQFGTAVCYCVAVVCAAIAIFLRGLLTPLWGSGFPYLTSFAAIVLVAWLGGLGPGLVVTFLCGAAAVYFWFLPTQSLANHPVGDLSSLSAFLFIGIAISVLNELLQRRERRDATVRRQAEETSSRLAAIIQSSDDAIVSKDLDGMIKSWNPAAEKMFGFTAAEAVGRSITIIIPADRLHEEDTVLGRIRRGLTVDHFETVRMRKDGSRLGISLTVSPVRNAAGQIIGVSKIARDISDRQRAEEERQKLLAATQAARADVEAALRAKDEFLAVVSHELRTPLNAVYGWGTMLRGGQLDEATAARGLEAIVRNAHAQVQLIDDLLDVSRVASGKMRLDVQSVDFPAVVVAAMDAINPAAVAKGVRLQSVLDPRAGPITGDPNRLQQVVWNLLSNAVKFTPKGGEVKIHLQRENAHIELIVSDTGRGITPELLPVLFERFRQGDSSTTREHAGLGLGLALVKSLVELHGGTVEAQSSGTGQGATFTVKLPLPMTPRLDAMTERHHPAASPALSLAAGARLDGLRVLVVDDDADALVLAATILNRAGALPIACHSASEALEEIRRSAPDVLISDIEMPGEDGYALIRKVRALERASGGGLPAIALTAYGRREDRVRTISAGYNMHVPKPVAPAELTTLVASLVGR